MRHTEMLKKFWLRFTRQVLSFIVLTAATLSAAMGANYPSKPITIMVWSSAGSSLGLMARQMGDVMSHDLGVSVVVENRTGGSGANAMYALLAKPADGYTLLLNTDSLLVNLNTKLKGKFTLSQFDLLALMESDHFVLVVNADSPYNTIKDFIAAAKRKHLTIGGFGATSTPYVQAALFAKQAGFKLHWVPFKGGKKADVALLGDHIDADLSTLSRVVQHVKAGKMRGLAMSGKKRSQHLPDVPTFGELGFPQHEWNHWRGIMAKSGLPKNVQMVLDEELRKVVESKKWKDYIHKTGVTPEFEAGNEFTKMAKTGLKSMGDVLSSAGH